jgi:hypothetical protein
VRAQDWCGFGASGSRSLALTNTRSEWEAIGRLWRRCVNRETPRRNLRLSLLLITRHGLLGWTFLSLQNLRENAVQSGGDTHEHAGPWLLTLVSLLMWERRVDPDLQFRIKVWQTVHFLYGCAFQVDVKEGMHTGAGDRQSATLLERSHHIN